jgi:hypothetical protein
MGEWRLVPPFLTSVLEGGEWSASRLCGFTAGERASSAHWIGSCVETSPGLDAAVGNQTPAVQSAARRCTD